jgi:hypothetical protein
LCARFLSSMHLYLQPPAFYSIFISSILHCPQPPVFYSSSPACTTVSCQLPSTPALSLGCTIWIQLLDLLPSHSLTPSYSATTLLNHP